MSRALFLPLLTVCLATLLSGCGRGEPPALAPKTPPTVQVAKPLVKKMEIWDEYQARIEGQKSVEVRSRVAGYLEKILFNDGDYVKAGDVLFEIDPRPFQADIDACKATVAEVEAKITLAKSNFQRAQELYQSNAVSKEVLETRRSELLSTQAMLLSAQARLQQAALNLEFTKITAPISGYVGRRMIDEGNLVSAATTLLTTIVSRDIVYAYFEVSERDILRYAASGLFNHLEKGGPPVRLKLMDENAPSHFGKLSYLDNSLSASSLQLRADIANDKGRLYPGMFAILGLRTGAPVDCVLVPEAAVGTDMVGRYVYTCDKDGNVSYQAVSVGEVIDGLQVVTEGLSGDENVIVSGMQRAMQNKQVTPVEVELK